LIQSGSGGYSLTAGGRCQVDAGHFWPRPAMTARCSPSGPREVLVAFGTASGLWQGKPLAEDTYAEWSQEHCATGASTAGGPAGRGDGALVSGDPAEAITRAERVLARQPLRETSAMLAVKTVAAGGGQAGPLAWSACAHILRTHAPDPVDQLKS
jgi:hypothetical protein